MKENPEGAYAKPEELMRQLQQKCTNSYLSEIGAASVASILSAGIQRIRELKERLHQKELAREEASDLYVDARTTMVKQREEIERLKGDLAMEKASLHEADVLLRAAQAAIAAAKKTIEAQVEEIATMKKDNWELHNDWNRRSKGS